MADFHPLLQAFLATCFTWGMTAVGAAAVFATRQFNRRLLDAMLGFASGVMLAASYWSLLAPAIEMSAGQGLPPWFPPAVGFLAGGACLRLIDRLLPHLHIGFPPEEVEGMPTSWRRSTLMVLAITMHNIPEGLAVGVAFAAVAASLPSASFPAAAALAVGIGIQNLPEGLAVALPLRREGLSRLKSFWYGQLSGMVEPLAGVAGAAAVLVSSAILPYALGFAAGAMVFVVVEQAVPESQRGGNTDLATLSLMLGFVLMMILDLAFG